MVAGCGECTSTPSDRPPSGAPSGAPSAAPQATPDATLSLDGERVRGLRRDALTEPTKLVDLMPPAARDPNDWVLLTAESADGRRRLTLRHVGKRYGHLTALIYNSSSELVFAMKRADGATDIVLKGVARIDVFTSEPEPATAPPCRLVLPGRPPTVLDADGLAALKRSRSPGGRGRSWVLREVITHVAGDIDYREIVVVGGGRRHTLKRAQLESDDEMFRLKLNRSGQLRYEHYRRQEDGTTKKVARLRDVKEIIVR